MPDQEKKTLELADDKIAEITKKISKAGEKNGIDPREIFGKATDETGKGQSFDTKNTEGVTTPKILIKNLRTFQGDVAEAIQNQNASVVTVALAEKKRREEREVRNPAPVHLNTEVKPLKSPILTNSNKKALILSMLFITLGIGSIVTLYIVQKNRPQITTIVEQESSILGYSTRSNFDVTSTSRNSFIEIITNQRFSLPQDKNSVHFFLLTKLVGEVTERLQTKDLFTILESSAPSSLIRAFSPDFMLGIYAENQNEVFLLISLESFERAYSGMLEWENTMNEDIGVLFSKRSIPIIERDPVTQATTSVVVTNFDLNPNLRFEDETIRNRDARILRNSRGETIFLYSFIDQKTLIITSSEATLSDITNKLIAERLIR